MVSISNYHTNASLLSLSKFLKKKKSEQKARRPHDPYSLEPVVVLSMDQLSYPYTMILYGLSCETHLAEPELIEQPLLQTTDCYHV